MQSRLQIFKMSFAIYISFCIHVKFLCVVICPIFVNLPVTAKRDIFLVGVVCDHCPLIG